MIVRIHGHQLMEPLRSSIGCSKDQDQDQMSYTTLRFMGNTANIAKMPLEFNLMKMRFKKTL